MGKKERLAQQIKDTELRWQQLGLRLGKIKLARELETRVEERLRLDALIADSSSQHDTVEAELSKLEDQLSGLQPTISAVATQDPHLDVFWSYSHADESLRNELARHLDALTEPTNVCHFHDRMMQAGETRDTLIDKRINDAHVILLLISADYLADDQLDSQQLRPALARHAAGAAVVVPIILRPCDLTLAPWATLVMLPKDGRPVVMWPDHDMVMHAVAKQIQTLLIRLKESLSRKSKE